MLKILHICAGWQAWNGAANIARMVMHEQMQAGCNVTFASWAHCRDLREAEEVWVHCSWLPCLWWAAFWARRFKWMPEASYDPVRLAYHGWKKRLVGPIERFFLRRADAVVATCEAEREWILKYEPRVKKVELIDIKRFFDLNRTECVDRVDGRALHLLYLGRRHPLKGIEYLEEAVRRLELGVESSELGVQRRGAKANSDNSRLELKIVSDAFGDEKEKVWDWCDVLVLPTLSENFGLVVAEALEKGKRVITTDGAPAWGEGLEMNEHGSSIRTGYGGRLLYLTGYRDGTDEDRVRLLKTAITEVCK